jgi:alkylation response protein AidB-like acyl-CoA dehydrogenase
LDSSTAKPYASEAANEIAAKCLQFFGACGFSKEYAIERFFREVRVTMIYEGTSEIQRLVIFRNLLKHYSVG